MVRIIFVVPLVQLFILGYAVTTDVRNVDLLFVDRDDSQMSRELLGSFMNNEYFNVKALYQYAEPVERLIRRGEAKAAVVVGRNFERGLEKGEGVGIQVLLDGENSNTSSVALSYCVGYINSFAHRIARGRTAHVVNPVMNIRYNPELESVYFMIPGIIGVLLTVLTMLLTGLAIVKEKEKGTFEQLMVTPLKPWQIIAGKTIPFAVLALVAMGIAMIVGVLWFKVPIRGSIVLFVLGAFCFIIANLGLGIFISTIAGTQQQALFTSWAFMVVFILLSGLFFPIENMPHWVQYITVVNPLKYFIRSARDLLLKGVGLQTILPDLEALVIIGISIFATSVMRFHKRLT